jgi:DNA-binding winged helix-turn-helix (wHTH) protein
MPETSQIPPLSNEKSNQKSPIQENYYFDGFAFYAQTDELVVEQSQQKIKLEPQISQLLTLLVKNQDQVLSKEFLQQALWPNTVVEQNSLYQVLTKLRKLLKDSSRSPKYIKTVPKKGYCFIAEVTESSPVITTDKLAVLTKFTQLSQLGIKVKVLSVTTVLLLLILLARYLMPSPNQQLIQNTVQPPTSYLLEDVSYQLGLEFDVTVHKKYNLMAYIKDINTLHITDKKGEVIYEENSDFRLAFPSWHPNNKQLAYWRYRHDQCELFVITSEGEQRFQAPPISCDSAIKPLWLNKDEIIVTINKADEVKLFTYRLGADAFVPLYLPLETGVKPVGALIAWDDNVYYLLKHNNQSTSLIDTEGNQVKQWDFPVWLFAYDAKTKSIISNDHQQGKALIATRLDGSSKEIVSSVEGIFTSLSVDEKGDIYTSIEHWQVNIRNNNNHALFSTSSIDYLANGNALGETAFVSKRSGFYEIYLNSHGKSRQLSNHKNHHHIRFLEWRPDLTLILSSQADKLAIYDKQGEVLQLTSSLSGNIKNIGWINNDTFYAFNGKKVHIYSLLGELLSSESIEGKALYFHHEEQSWLLFNDGHLSALKSLTDTATPLIKLSDIQGNALKNIRLRQGSLYWQSKWSREDKIWRFRLDGNLGDNKVIELVHEGQLIWNFDVTSQGEINISKMESIQGDIKRLVLTH